MMTLNRPALGPALGPTLRPTLRPTSRAIRYLRVARLAFHFAGIAFFSAVLLPFLGPQQRTQLQRRWSRQILSILSIDLKSLTQESPPGRLIVANHVSWLDIFVINAAYPAAFVSKAELRQWPFIGWLATKYDTVFLQRGSRGHARIVNTQIDALLNAGKDVAIFPEGTTTDGTHLLGFHAALLQPAIETGHTILPLAISYHDAHGERSLDAAYAGDTTLMQCFSAILANRSMTVRVVAEPAIATLGQSRKTVAQIAHRAIATRLGFLPENNPPGKSPDPQAESQSALHPTDSPSLSPANSA